MRHKLVKIRRERKMKFNEDKKVSLKKGMFVNELREKQMEGNEVSTEH